MLRQALSSPDGSAVRGVFLAGEKGLHWPVIAARLADTLPEHYADITADAISANGQIDVLRYGRVFKARQLAQVRGAGDYYDGKYYVKSVTHNIKRGEYKQSFELSRNGLISTVPQVAA